MRSFRILAGVLLIIVGSIAAFGRLGANFWWIVAAAIAAAGLLGIAAAIRPTRPSPVEDDSDYDLERSR